MSSLLATVLIALSSLASVGFLASYSSTHLPTWAEQYGDAKAWRKLGTVAGVVGMAGVVYALALTPEAHPLVQWSTSATLGVTGAVMVFAAATDFKVRLVSRHMLYWAMALTAVPSLALLAHLRDQHTAVLVLAIFAFSGFVYIVLSNKVFGSSDVRAMMLLGAAFAAPMGYLHFLMGALFMFAVFLAAALYTVVSWHSVKVSLPAVPLIVAPYWLFLAGMLAYPLV